MSADSAKGLRESVKWFVLSEELIARGDHVLVATSGGPDSMALLSVLGSIAEELGFRLAAAYFDHQIRDSAEADKQCVAALAKRLSIPLYSGTADVRAEAAASGDTIEEAARKARYQFLFSTADQIKATRIATGHTADDQAETVLMRIIRGTGIRGLAGIPVRRGRIIRPLLSQSRRNVLAWCESAGIRYATDPTNEEVRFFRNRIRHELLPILRSEYNEGVDTNLRRLADLAGDVVRSVRDKTDPLIHQNVRKNRAGEWVVNITHLGHLDDIAIIVFLGDVLSGPVGCDMDFTKKHYDAVVSLIRDARGSGKSVHLPGITIKKEYENLVIARTKAAAQAQPVDYRAALTVPGEINAAGVTVRTEIVDRTDVADVKAGAHAAVFALERLKLPLVLRCPSAGDRMRPFGMTGSKKLSDIFSDRKVPGRQRARSLVVADAEEILWLVGVTTSEKCRVGHATEKVLRITVDEGGGSR